MKVKIVMLVFAVVAVALAVVLLVTRQKTAEQHKRDAEAIAYNSNQWQQTQVKLDDEKQTNTRLNQELDSQKKAFGELTNSYTQTVGKLLSTGATLASTAASLKSAEEKNAQLESENAKLKDDNKELDKEAAELTTALTNLTSQITETRRLLAASEGDKAFLEKELKRLMTEKAELERQFNDLKILRAQVAKLKEELNISRRLEWIKKGLSAGSDQKGASQLIQGANAPSKKPKTTGHYDLNVEVTADGAVKVIPPMTNAPAK